MNEDDDRAFLAAGEKLNPVSRAETVANGARDVPLAIGSRVARPTGDQRGGLRNPRPVVVFDLVVDGRVQDFTMLVLVRTYAPRLWSWPADASVRGHPLGQDPKTCRRSTSRVRRPSCETRH